MTNDWIIDVLTDLRKFTASNSMEHLSDRLDETIQLAMHELNAVHVMGTAGMNECEQSHRHAERAFTGDNA